MLQYMFVINLSRYTKKHTELVTDSSLKSRARPTQGIVNYWISYLETFKWLVEPWTDSKREIEKPPVWKENLLLYLFSCSVRSGSLQPHELQHPRFPVLHHLLELAQTHVHWVGDAIPPSHPLLSPYPPAFYLSQHQDLFQWVSSSHQVAKGLEFQL